MTATSELGEVVVVRQDGAGMVTAVFCGAVEGWQLHCLEWATARSRPAVRGYPSYLEAARAVRCGSVVWRP
jgi:hypothetical protein